MDTDPGGLEVILQEAGNAFVEVRHSRYAEDLRTEYDIQALAGP